MRFLVLTFPTLLAVLISSHAYALGTFFCAVIDGRMQCFTGFDKTYYGQAQIIASTACDRAGHGAHCFGVSVNPFENTCAAVAAQIAHPDTYHTYAEATTQQEAFQLAERTCIAQYGSCYRVISACDGQPPWVTSNKQSNESAGLDVFRTILGGIYFGVGIAIALLVYAKRDAIKNFLVNGSLPRKLPIYGEDIQVIFKRTQRINWYGRVVFGVVANLAMTHQQLIDVRKYWLGRAIAFDSLRRQRQNDLVRMHLQLATTTTPQPKHKSALSQLLAILQWIFLFVFYLLRALISFFFGFLFIRVTVAKLVRGTIIESNDFVLILQAKQAIEETAKYLKEYLDTANTFDGRDEVYDAE